MQTSYKPNDQPTVSMIIFFDGVCGLCSHFVDFVMKRDAEKKFRFATLQGKHFEDLKSKYPWLEGQDSIVISFRMVNRDVILMRSRAIFFVLNELGGAWKSVAWLKVFPAFLTDLGYRIVAKIRYKIFGKKETCRIPTPAERAFFLN
ncbi:MAG: DCC1-like thiol-disulfide oxidoreductase family protein [Verrucomicrobiota bacterium]